MRKGNNLKLWCGVPDVYFIWHGEWSDPEVLYKRKIFNLPVDVETPLYEYYQDDCRKKNIKDNDNYDDYVKYVKNHPNEVHNVLDDLIELGAYREV